MMFPVEDDYMATRPERSMSLDNLPFLNLKWGMQRRMKCTNVDSGRDCSGSGDHQRRSPTFEFANSSVVIPLRFGEANNRNRPLWKPPSKSAEKGSDEATKKSREKIVRNKMTESMFRKDSVHRTLVFPCEDERPEEVKPWNLRRRKASCKAPIRFSNENQCNEIRTEERIVSRKRRRGVIEEAEKKEPVKFSLQLSRKEIEEDFMQIFGRRLHSRPKKRPRNVQKQLDNVFPGLYLTEVTLDLYKVPEVVEKGKNPQRS